MVGTTVSHYRVLQQLGAGGMGIVYLAEDENLHRKVALKFLPPAVAADPTARTRFSREAQSASALDHPNIATIYETGEWDGQPFIAMAYYEGETLKQRIDRGPLPLTEIAGIVGDVAAGLAAAHAADIVHRDLKPANIILTRNGPAKILDFGLAKMMSVDQATATRITGSGTTVGTVAYMAPEQAQGQAVDQRADVWALGVMLYEMLTGRLPFKAENAPATLLAIITEKPRPLRELRPDVPPELERIVTSALERQRAARTVTAADICRDVAAFQARLSSGERPVVSAPSPWAWLKRKRIAVPVLLLLVVLGALGAWVWNRGARVRWAREQAVPEVLRLRDEGRWFEAFDLAKQAETYLGNDPALSRLWPSISRSLSVQTTPPGADVSYADYNSANPRWEHVDRSPFNDARVPAGVILRLRIEKTGVTTIDDAVADFGPILRTFTMEASNVVPPGMVRVSEDDVPKGIFVPGLDHLPPIQLASFWIDRYEVTNKQFKTFLDAGGYQKPEYWRQEFIKGGQPISWNEAIATFHDATDRPGPAGWELGDYPQGQDEYPVTGVSWYEAAAYAEFVGKALPTIFHWSRAAEQRLAGSVVPLSNFSRRGPTPVGGHRGMHRFGTYDMAGNVKEWSWNLGDPDRRYIMGGAWDEPVYMFTDADARSPFDRDATFGFRCVKYIGVDPLPATATAMLEFPSRDYSKEKPVSDEVFRAYTRMYAYDATDLKPVIEQTDDTSPDWRRERITFAAAYGSERMSAYLFVPKDHGPPYQTVVYFPGSNALRERTSESAVGGRPSFDFLIKSGRAVMYPIYKSTHERGDGLESDYPNMTTTWRDHVVAWSKDLGRSIDYLDTRPDIAHERLAYYGVSWGAQMGAILPAVEPRLRVSLLIVGGFNLQRALPEVDPINFTPRIKIPTLMLNGRYDFFYPTATSQEPMFRLMGSPPEHKRRVVYETGHNIPRPDLIKETLTWLDKYLGPVKQIT